MPTEPDADENKKSYIEQIFDKLGIQHKLLGYSYLVDAILLTSENENQNIYPLLCSKYNKSKASIEHAMQNAINKAWNCTDTESLYKYYHAKINLDRGRPTVTELVHYYADKIKHT